MRYEMLAGIFSVCVLTAFSAAHEFGSVSSAADRMRAAGDHPGMAKAFAFLMRTDLKDLACGRYAIDGTNVWATVSEANLQPLEPEMTYEAHRRYIDVQAPLTGEESYGILATPENPGPFNVKDDYVLFKAAGERKTLKPGEFAVFRPPFGAHAPGRSVTGARTIRKVVVKVLADMPPVSKTSVKFPLLQMRLRQADTATYETWQSNLCALAAYPGCCDEVWFSTGIGMPELAFHRAHAEILKRAADDLRARGIVPSLQFQATLGHAEKYGRTEIFSGKTWGGWTDRHGLELKYCNCPRQPGFRAYLKEVSRIYAPIGFHGVWIDDDLRYNNHRPADTEGLYSGCWCKTCLADFNAAEKGGNWTAETLAKALPNDKALATRWRNFSMDSLCGVAQAIAEGFCEKAPSTLMALQQGNWPDATDSVKVILATLHRVSGREVGYRPGGGAYYDMNPNDVVWKSITTGIFRSRVGNPDYVAEWTPEIECAPRAYYSRSPQGALVEGFTALMYGMNRVSYFLSAIQQEDPALYARNTWPVLDAAAPVLHGFAEAVEGCKAEGLTAEGMAYALRQTGVPLLAGVGISRGNLTADETQVAPWTINSWKVQDLRNAMDQKAGGMSALLVSPFMGLMMPYLDCDGHLKVVALQNVRIDAQREITLRLRHLPEGMTSAVWHEMKAPPVTLPLTRDVGGDVRVMIPQIAAWNGGYLTFVK